MSQYSKIEWCHHTANLWWGCKEVHEGCTNCYARVWAQRWGLKVWGNDNPRSIVDSVWKLLTKIQKNAQNAGEVHRVFVGSMMDIFERPKPLINRKGESLPFTTGNLRDQLFKQIDEGVYPNLMFLMLTKRPSNINKFIPERWKTNPPTNVMFGTSPVDQETADRLIPQLLTVHGRRFLSVEPQLDEVTLMPWLKNQEMDWVIQGGESGRHKRPFNINWARKLREECAETKTPYFFKQIDKKQEIPADLQVRQFYK